MDSTGIDRLRAYAHMMGLDALMGPYDFKAKFILASIVVSVFLFTFTIWRLVMDDARDRREESETTEETLPSKSKETKPSFKMPLHGTTDLYTWSQTDDDMEIKIPIDTDIKTKDIQVIFTSTRLTVRIKGDTYLIEDLFEEILPKDSLWQFDTEKNQKYLLIILHKKNVEIEKSGMHLWPGVSKKPPVSSETKKDK